MPNPWNSEMESNFAFHSSSHLGGEPHGFGVNDKLEIPRKTVTSSELDKLLHEHWMSISEEERFLTCGRLYSAEKAVLERLAPAEYSLVQLREFVYYHMHGEQMPEGAVRHLEELDICLGRS